MPDIGLTGIHLTYTRDYPTVISAIEPREPVETNTKETETTTTMAATDFTFENHPLLAHIHLYIFCSIYLIPGL